MDETVMEEQAMCMPVPSWFPRDHWPVADFPFMTLQIQLIVVYCVTQAIHRLFFKRFALPPLLSQLLAGLVLSPTIHIRKTNVLWRGHDMIFPPVGEEVRRCISMLGYGLSLFMTAVKMDLTVATKMGKRPLIIGLSVLIITGATSSLAAYAYARANFKPETDHEKILNLASAAPLLALTSFPVIGALLSDMKLLNSELGRLALSSGIICDATSIAFNMLSKTVSKSLQSAPPPGFKLANELGKDFVLMAFLVSVVVVLRGLLNWMIRETPKGRPVKQGYLTIVFTLTLMGGILTHSCGEFVLLGFFVIGIAIPEGPPLGSGIVDKFDFLVSEVLQPFFVTTCAMRADVFDVKFTGSFAHGVNLLILCAYGTKLIVCLFHGVVYKMAFPDALAFAVIMSSKGFVDVANFAMFRQSELIWKETYSYLILVTTIAAFVGPMSIKLLYNPMRKYAGYKKRCIMRADNDADLRVLACVCRPDNISALTSLIAQSNPTMGKPLIVDVLQLLRLKGRAQPIVQRPCL